jgi:hypothetical protein
MWVGSRPIYILMNGMKKENPSKTEEFRGWAPKERNPGKKFPTTQERKQEKREDLMRKNLRRTWNSFKITFLSSITLLEMSVENKKPSPLVVVVVVVVVVVCWWPPTTAS